MKSGGLRSKSSVLNSRAVLILSDLITEL